VSDDSTLSGEASKVFLMGYCYPNALFRGQIVDGVAWLHEQGICHLDIKPENVVIHVSSSNLTLDIYTIFNFVCTSNTKFSKI